MNINHLCMGCMKEIGEEKQCPYCGFYSESPQMAPYLPLRTIVNDRYLIGKLLDYNGDGATYMAFDLERNSAVTLREFFPDAIAVRKKGEQEIAVMSGCEITYRDCLQSFLDLWHKLVKMRGLSALIVVYSVFEANNTAYAVCEYSESVTLRDYLLSSNTGYISWEQARSLFMPVLSTLGTLHSAGIIHRGISPTTLIIGPDGKMRISGFSIWQARTSRGDLTAQLFSGYAAIEQYGFDGQQGAWTDIYAFGAVLYRALVGSTPIEATSRVTNDRLMVPGKFAEVIPAYVINALINAMQILPEDRTRTVEQLRAELSASPVLSARGLNYASRSKSKAENNNAKNKDLQNSKGVIAKTCIITILTLMVIAGVLVLTVFRENIGLEPLRSIKNDTSTTSIDNSQTFVVPNFVSELAVDVVNDAIWSQRFTFEEVQEYGDEKYKVGEIMAQSIKQGQTVSKGTKIVLTVCAGPEQITVPENVVGKKYKDAVDELTKLGFSCEKTAVITTDATLADTVKSISLTPGKVYNKGTKIFITVWTMEETVAETTD